MQETVLNLLMSEYNKISNTYWKKLKGGTKENYVNFNAENILINEKQSTVWRLDWAAGEAEKTATGGCSHEFRDGKFTVFLFFVCLYACVCVLMRGVEFLAFKKKKKKERKKKKSTVSRNSLSLQNATVYILCGGFFAAILLANLES